MASRNETGAVTLAGNEARKFISGSCNYLYCYEQDALVEVELFRDNQLVESHMVERLLNLPAKNFDEFRVVNTSASANVVRFFFGPGQYVPNTDRSLVIIDDTTPPTVIIEDTTPVSVSIDGGSVTLNQSNIINTATSVADVSATATATTQVVTAGATNVVAMVSNPEGSGVTLRVGCHAGVGAANGTPLPEGATWERFTSTGVWVYNPGAGAVMIAVEVGGRV